VEIGDHFGTLTNVINEAVPHSFYLASWRKKTWPLAMLFRQIRNRFSGAPLASYAAHTGADHVGVVQQLKSPARGENAQLRYAVSTKDRSSAIIPDLP
jgi:hypothetical protein